MKNTPIVSVVIINHNGSSYLKGCLNSIVKSNSKDIEVVVVDNGSSDSSLDMLETFKGRHSIQLRLVSLDKNYGPAFARNRGVEISKGKYISFLDNDTIVDKNWAIEAVMAFEKDYKLGIIQCKLLLNKDRDKIDYVGEYIGSNGFLVQRARAGEIDRGQYDQPVKILAAKSAGMFVRKDVFEKIGGFDSDYFIYVEETDLGWRCWLAGYQCKYIANSIVYHEFGTSSIILSKSKNEYNAKFHGSKNYILTLIKNFEIKNIYYVLPLHIILWLGLAFYSLIKGKIRPAFWILKGICWNVIYLKKSLAKRKVIQIHREISDERLMKIVMQKKELSYFIRKATDKVSIGNAEGFIKNDN